MAGFSGQIIDQDSPLEGPGGKHMRYAAAMKALGNDNSVEPFSTYTTAGFKIKSGKKIVVILTGATDYDAEKMDLDPSADPYQKWRNIAWVIGLRSARRIRQKFQSPYLTKLPLQIPIMNWLCQWLLCSRRGPLK
ncbi:MAG: hypothetical protein PHI28_00445 [Mangrovibacterium sp.]|nr:hypothetical protein [Mangrovibacterium sp.]